MFQKTVVNVKVLNIWDYKMQRGVIRTGWRGREYQLSYL